MTKKEDPICKQIKELIAHYQYKMDNADRVERFYYADFINKLKDLLVWLAHN
jgi:hypothetical protein